MAVARFEQIQQTLVKAREELSQVDENIKKVTGRDPSEFRRFPQSRFGRGGRRRSFRDGNEVVAPPAKRMAVAEGSNDQPVSVVSSVVRPRQERQEGIEQRLQNLAEGGAAGGATGQSGTKTGVDENKPAIQSSVVARPDRARRESMEEKEEDKKRNRRMFGQLMGTLKKFKNETQHDAAKMRHRLQLEAKIEEENQKERELAAQERRQLYSERRTKQMELRKLEHQVHLYELSQEWEEHGRQLASGNFIRLKSSPALFYKPGTHTEATLKLVEETKQQILAEAADRKKEVEIMIADREVLSQQEPMEEKDGVAEGEDDGEGGENGKGANGREKRERGPEEDVLMRNVGEETEGMLGGDDEGEGNQGADAEAATDDHGSTMKMEVDVEKE